MSLLEIRTVARSDEERAIATQVLAFATDPVMRWAFPEQHTYLRHFPTFARHFGGRAFEKATAHAAPDFAGVALWLPPNVEPDGAAVAAFFTETLKEPRKSTAFRILERMGEFHIEEPHWYLSIIGVDPSRQRGGIGAALLRHALDACDRDGLPVYLESSNPRNISLYQRHGFEVIGEIQVDDAPLVTPMLRPPAV